MSGIFAVFHLQPSPVVRSALEAMLRRIRYRGQDAHQLTIAPQGNAALGCALQKVTTESAFEVQPLTRDHLTIVANARLDARDDLVSALKATGQPAGAGLENPHVIPDTELILRAFMAWGDDCVHHLLGDFSFVIWDAVRQRVFAARDPLGVQPLYYAWKQHPDFGPVFVCANELTTVRLYPIVGFDLNDEVIADFLLFGGHQWIDQTRTVYTDIKPLPPAHTAVCDAEGLRLQRYWTMPNGEPLIKFRSEADYVQHYRALLKQAVQDRLHTDRLVIWMSGGVDSTSLAALALELVREGKANTDIQAIVGVYDRIHPDTEAYYAGLVGNKLKLPIAYIPLDEFTIREPLPLPAQPSQNFQRGHGERMLECAASMARLNFSGFGSDESLRESALWDVLRRLPPTQAIELYMWMWRFLGRRPGLTGLTPYLKERFDPRTRRATADAHDRAAYRYPEWISAELEARFNLRERWSNYWNWEPEVGAAPYQPEAYKGIVNNIWETAAEPMDGFAFTPTMATLPYIDLRLLTFLMSMPPQPFNHRKAILRRAMEGALPDDILKRPKQPLGFLTLSMLRQPGTEWVDTWEPIPELARYVRREAVPPVSGDNAKPGMTLHNLRPLALNNWLKHYYARVGLKA